MLTDRQPQQVPRGPALLWGAGVGGGVPGQGGPVRAGQSAAAAGLQRPRRAQPPLHPHLLLPPLRRRLHGPPAQEDQVSPRSSRLVPLGHYTQEVVSTRQNNVNFVFLNVSSHLLFSGFFCNFLTAIFFLCLVFFVPSHHHSAQISKVFFFSFSCFISVSVCRFVQSNVC